MPITYGLETASHAEIKQPFIWKRGFWEHNKHELLCRLGIRFDPNRSTFQAPKDEKRIPIPTKTKLPTNVSYSKSFRNLVEEVTDPVSGVIEMSVYKIADKNADKYTGEVTDLDRQLLAERDLNEIKAVRLKPLWAQGLSSQAVSEDISRSERGYSWAELKKYWAVFNESAKINSDDGENPLPRKRKGKK
jgi:hypothetical protein